MMWRRRPQVLWRAVPGYLALATPEGRTLEVGGAAHEVWTRLADWVGEDALAGDLAVRYSAEERDIARDVQSLLHHLHAEGFVEHSG